MLIISLINLKATSAKNINAYCTLTYYYYLLFSKLSLKFSLIIKLSLKSSLTIIKKSITSF